MPRDYIKPAITITSPTKGASVSGLQQITATATDNVIVKSVKFFVNGVEIIKDIAAPYATQYNFSTPGTYTIKAEAVDKAGNLNSDVVIVVKDTVVVVEPPAEETFPLAFLQEEPPLIAQGSEGSCFSVAFELARSIIEYYATNATAYDPNVNRLSAEMLYNNVRATVGCGGGCSPLNTMNFIKAYGICKASLLPYDSTNGCSVGIMDTVEAYYGAFEAPNATVEQAASAANFKISSFENGVMGDTTWVKRQLYTNKIALPFSCTIDDNMYYIKDPYIWSSRPATTVINAPHGMCITGWDDTKGVNGCWRASNSFGLAHGDQGHIWIDYKFAPQIIGYLFKMIR